jgi:hypothetical protein
MTELIRRSNYLTLELEQVHDATLAFMGRVGVQLRSVAPVCECFDPLGLAVRELNFPQQRVSVFLLSCWHAGHDCRIGRSEVHLPGQSPAGHEELRQLVRMARESHVRRREAEGYFTCTVMQCAPEHEVAMVRKVLAESSKV